MTTLRTRKIKRTIPKLETFVPNSFQTPNAYVDVFMAFLTGDEYKVLSYATRRILGFQKRQDRIAISQFTDGIRTREGEVLDRGTGLEERTVRKCLANLAAFGLMVREAENDPKANQGVLWGLQWDPKRIDWAALQKRADGWKKPHSSKASSKRKAPGIARDPLPSHGSTPLPSHGSTPPPLAGEAQKTGKSSVKNQAPVPGSSSPAPTKKIAPSARREAAAAISHEGQQRETAEQGAAPAAAAPLQVQAAPVVVQPAQNRDAYAKAFHEPAPREETQLAELEAHYSSEWVRDAISNAALRRLKNPDNPLPYLVSILVRWQKDGKDPAPSGKNGKHPDRSHETAEERQLRITAVVAQYAQP